MTVTIRNCRVISPGIDRPGATIVIDGGTITAVEGEDGTCERNDEQAERNGGPTVRNDGPTAEAGGVVFDAGGKIALPGFVDVHCHGAAGHDVTDGTVQAIEAIARAKLAEGVTTFCPTTLTLPPGRLEEAMRAVAEYGRRETFARVGGVHLEGPFINAGCAGAQNTEHVRPPDIKEVRRLHAIAPVALVTYAPEMDGDGAFLRGLLQEGIIPSCGHSAASSAAFGRAYDAGLRNLTHFCNQMTPLHHRDIGLVGRGLLHDDLIVELICDGVHLSPEMIALVFRVKPIDAIALVTDSIRATGLGDGEYDLGGIPIRVAGGIARLTGTENLAGSTLRMNRALAVARAATGRPLSELAGTTSLNQARFLGLEGVGRIEAGWRGDIVLVDDDLAIEAVFVGGERRV